MLTGPEDIGTPKDSGCPTPGCTGVGHIKGAKYTGHHRYGIRIIYKYFLCISPTRYQVMRVFFSN